jgi:hypothetical protein
LAWRLLIFDWFMLEICICIVIGGYHFIDMLIFCGFSGRLLYFLCHTLCLQLPADLMQFVNSDGQGNVAIKTLPGPVRASV